MNIFHESQNQSPTIYYSIMALDYIIPVAFVIVTFTTILWLWWIVRKKDMKIESKIKIYQVIPIYRNYLKMQTSFQFATHLSSLLQTGMPMKDILDYMTQQKDRKR